MKYKILVVAYILAFITGCTISFQNISTNGKATDLVDEEQNASPDVSPNLVIPASTL